MERINVTQAARQFSDLLNRVAYQGASFELERNHRVIAHLTPVSMPRQVAVADLNRLFAHLPRLDEDAENFAETLESVRRELPSESDPWG